MASSPVSKLSLRPLLAGSSEMVASLYNRTDPARALITAMYHDHSPLSGTGYTAHMSSPRQPVRAFHAAVHARSLLDAKRVHTASVHAVRTVLSGGAVSAAVIGVNAVDSGASLTRLFSSNAAPVPNTSAAPYASAAAVPAASGDYLVISCS